MELRQQVSQAVIDGSKQRVVELVHQALDQGIDALALFDDLAAGIRVVGDRFGKGEVFLPELVLGANAMKAGTAILHEELARRKVTQQSAGRVLIGTVAGDIHDIGKNLVALMLQTGGFEVVDLGVDVSADRFVRAALELQPDIVAMSALLTPSLPQMQKVLEGLDRAGLRGRVRVMVGGAAVTPSWARQVGADGHAADAASALERAAQLLEGGGERSLRGSI